MPLDPTPVPEELKGARIALLIAGGIAAYKIVDLASALTQAGAEVRVAMTASATRFVGAASFQGVTGKPVLTGLWSGDGPPEPHVFLGDWAQVSLLAPATANVISRVAKGQSDDIVTATLLAARGPVVVAPAMNDAMWAKVAVQENLSALKTRGMIVVASSAALMKAMADAMRQRYDFAGRRVVVTAGGTREPIDPVRYISNYSSGKMGFAIAAAAADRGARVTLVTTATHPAHHGIDVKPVETADDMMKALRRELAGADLLVMSAAVADFRPARTEDQKIRREESPRVTLALEPIQDIIATLGKEKEAEGVFRVGFAAEGSDLETKGLEKMKRKGLQAIVANDISRKDIAFGSDFNEGVMLFADGAREDLPRMTKRDMADRILDLVHPRLATP